MTTTTSLVQSGLFGGFSGKGWDDRDSDHNINRIGIIQVYANPGDAITGIQTAYFDNDGPEVWGPLRGSNSGFGNSIHLAPGEAIIAVEFSYIQTEFASQLWLIGLQVVTQSDAGFKQYGPYGNFSGIKGVVFGNIVSLYGTTFSPTGNIITGLGVWGQSPLIVAGLQPPVDAAISEADIQRMLAK